MFCVVGCADDCVYDCEGVGEDLEGGDCALDAAGVASDGGVERDCRVGDLLDAGEDGCFVSFGEDGRGEGERDKGEDGKAFEEMHGGI